MSKARTVVLVILDGWGIGRKDTTNPIYVAQPPIITALKNRYPAGALQASGIAVGLPWGEEGNSEVGHLTMGAGRIVYQHFPRITMAIEDGSFFANPALTEACDYAAKRKTSAHLIGLLSEGNVHASLTHIRALIDLCIRFNVPDVRCHFFADGKDSPPKSFLNLLNSLNLKSPAALASVAGRYYAMDRDGHQDRTDAAYAALTGSGPLAPNVTEYIEAHYRRGLTDEFIEPALVGSEKRGIKENDAVIFFNFREDSIRQIAQRVCEQKNLFIATMTNYAPSLPARVAFPAEVINNTLGEILASAGKYQFRVAETEKYAHITYFFNGLKNEPLKNEYRVLVPSRNIARPDDYPELMAGEVAGRAAQAIEENIDFILVNFANPDVIAHTGNFDAAVKTIDVVDRELNTMIKAALNRDAALIITSDHGNVEQMRNPQTGAPETRHNDNPVPVYLVGKEFERLKDPATAERSENEVVGILADIAPTILHLLGLPKPMEMKGEDLIGRLL